MQSRNAGAAALPAAAPSTLERWAPAAGSLFAALFVAGLIVPAAHAEPFLTRNQNPLLALYGLPAPLPARLPPSAGCP